MRCPSCGSSTSFYWSGLDAGIDIKCISCGRIGMMEEFGCIVHCQESKVTAEEALDKVEQGLSGVDEAASLRGQMQTIQRALDWERECSRQVDEEIAEARYWARKLYRDTAVVFQTVDTKFEIPQWVTWVERSPRKAITP